MQTIQVLKYASSKKDLCEDKEKLAKQAPDTLVCFKFKKSDSITIYRVKITRQAVYIYI